MKDYLSYFVNVLSPNIESIGESLICSWEESVAADVDWSIL